MQPVGRTGRLGKKRNATARSLKRHPKMERNKKSSGLCANQDQEAKERIQRKWDASKKAVHEAWLRQAAADSSNLEVALLGSVLEGAKENPNMDGLNLNLSVQELLLPHAADSPNTFAGSGT